MPYCTKVCIDGVYEKNTPALPVIQPALLFEKPGEASHCGSSAKPGYTKYKPHYDIALSRAESEQEVSLKEAIKTGLQKLKPATAKKKNSFWGRVDKL